MNAIDIVVPVYLGYEPTRRCIESVLGNPKDLDFELVVVNDKSPEPDLVQYLEHLAQTDAITLLTNEKNCGFVSAVNRGMAYHTDRDVVLLNSDTVVANNWLSRLRKCAYLESRIGTLTPFSNNGEICSFPRLCQTNELPKGYSIPELDSVFARQADDEYIDIPTSVGFCMYIKRACLNEVGMFDVSTFARGYGEENDFCMRASKSGWRHALCPTVFVYHQGAVSFGEEKRDLSDKAVLTLNRLYPGYQRTVYEFIEKDPAKTFRIKVLMDLLRYSVRTKVLFIVHGSGGGTWKHIKELADFFADKIDALVIRPSDDNLTSLYLSAEDKAERLHFRLPNEYSQLRSLCEYLNVSRLHFHHIMGIDSCVFKLSRDLKVHFDITLHDYYFINANPTLSKSDGRFYGRSTTNNHEREIYNTVAEDSSARLWRNQQEELLNRAERIFSPSLYAAELYGKYFPSIKLVVAFHPDWEKDVPYPPVRCKKILSGAPLKVAALGSLNKEKGSLVFEECAAILNKLSPEEFKFNLIGYTYGKLGAFIDQYGPYQDECLNEIINEIDPDVIWFPCQWPETYSYTLSASLRSGRPIVAPDIGSFPERLENRPYTWVISWQKNAYEFASFFQGLKKEVFLGLAYPDTKKWDGQPNLRQRGFIYSRDYLNRVSGKDKDTGWYPSKEFVNQHCSYTPNRDHYLTTKERILLMLVKLRSYKIIDRVCQIIPVHVQRSIKRYLSLKPFHEIKKHE